MPAHASCPRNTSLAACFLFCLQCLHLITCLIDKKNTSWFGPSRRFSRWSMATRSVRRTIDTQLQQGQEVVLSATLIATTWSRILEHLHETYILVSSFCSKKRPQSPKSTHCHLYATSTQTLEFGMCSFSGTCVRTALAPSFSLLHKQYVASTLENTTCYNSRRTLAPRL